MTITKKTKLNVAITKNKKATELLIRSGLSCACCPMAMQETIEQGCLAHGMNKKQIDELIKKLNKK
jgi:hybrid cluster-associated redox disulfide protein